MKFTDIGMIEEICNSGGCFWGNCVSWPRWFNCFHYHPRHLRRPFHVEVSFPVFPQVVCQFIPMALFEIDCLSLSLHSYWLPLSVDFCPSLKLIDLFCKGSQVRSMSVCLLTANWSEWYASGSYLAFLELTWSRILTFLQSHSFPWLSVCIGITRLADNLCWFVYR